MKKITLSRKKQTLIDDSDFEMLSKFNWYVNENAEKTKLYAMRTRLKTEEKVLSGTKVYMHRFILNVKDPKISVQHKNGNTLDNRRENLVQKKKTTAVKTVAVKKPSAKKTLSPKKSAAKKK